MKVFKFGGASVKDPDSVRNVARIIQKFNAENITVIISAMGKTTNELEKVVEAVIHQQSNLNHLVQAFKDKHLKLAQELFLNQNDPAFLALHNRLVEFDWIIEESTSNNQSFIYDQIVSFGEILSTQIISDYLNSVGIKNQFVDARDYIKTDDTYQEGKVDWDKTFKCVSNPSSVFQLPANSKPQLWITQGFIGGTDENYTTTLGREGSDYSAAIFAYCLQANDVTIWKDVPGLLNADPKWFDETVLIPQLSYQDAIELAYYGATVIHPKTIKPLQNKKIPLLVRSFINFDAPGTKIADNSTTIDTPCFIFKVNQILLSISPKDFSFIAEENFGELFKTFHTCGIKIHAMQNSAIQFSVCIDNQPQKIEKLTELLQTKFNIQLQKEAELITIRYYNSQTIERVTQNKEILLDIRSKTTCQIVVKNLG